MSCDDGSFERVKDENGLGSVEEEVQEFEEVVMAHSGKAGSHRSCAHVLVAEGPDGKISCPTHRRANEPHGCPWLYKQSGEDEVTDPAAWTT